eukprot:1668979-Pyramimonas_sp.AAC.1
MLAAARASRNKEKSMADRVATEERGGNAEADAGATSRQVAEIQERQESRGARCKRTAVQYDEAGCSKGDERAGRRGWRRRCHG